MMFDPDHGLCLSGQSPSFCGRSGKQLKKQQSSQRGMLIDDWSRAVKSLNVSSSVNQASRLIDCSDQCWQSSGSQGKVRVKTWALTGLTITISVVTVVNVVAIVVV